MKALGVFWLEEALDEFEALRVHGHRNKSPRDFHKVVGGIRIGVESTMKFFGFVFNSRWDFSLHIQRLVRKWRLLRNLGDPNASCRKLYATICGQVL